MKSDVVPATGSLLTVAQFRSLADVPPEAQWLANLTSVQTRRAYPSDLAGFMRFTGIAQPEEFRAATCWPGAPIT